MSQTLFSTRFTSPGRTAAAALGLWLLGACGGNSSSRLDSQTTTPTTPTSTATDEPAASTAPTASTPPVASSSSPPAGPTATAPAAADGNYWMNFFPGKNSPVKVGGRFSVWLGFDLSQPSRDYHPPDTFFNEGKIAPNVETFQELSAACGSPASSLAQAPLKEIGPGQPTWVDHVTVVMTSPAQLVPGPAPEGPSDVFMCYGYRVGTAWSWELQRLTSTWQPDKARYTIDLPVKKQGVNAFRIMFEGNVSRHLDQVMIATKPGP